MPALCVPTRALTRLVVLGSVLLGTPALSRAQPSEIDPQRQAAARALFAEGLAELEAERWASAADRFERAHALRPTPEIAYNLSSALIRMGRLVRASELLRQIAGDARASSTVRAAARARLDELLPRLGRLTVNVDGSPAVVRLNGHTLDPAMLGVALPVDPGTHTLEAAPRGGRAVTRTVTLDEGAQAGVTLAVGEGARSRSVLGKWWVWTAAAAVAAGSATAFALTRGDDPLRPGNAGKVHVGGK